MKASAVSRGFPYGFRTTDKIILCGELYISCQQEPAAEPNFPQNFSFVSYILSNKTTKYNNNRNNKSCIFRQLYSVFSISFFCFSSNCVINQFHRCVVYQGILHLSLFVLRDQDYNGIIFPIFRLACHRTFSKFLEVSLFLQ